MSELAFNMNGEAFEVPAAAVGWRVRRMKLKGAPEVVYGRDGVPLVLALEADIEDVRREVGGTPGRYRLDPVGENHRPLHEVPAAYVYVHADPRPSEPNSPAVAPATTEGVVIEAMRMNAELARAVIDRFPMMMEAAAVLLRAADGAGLPARPGMAGGDAEEDDAAPSSGFDLNGLLRQFAPILMMGLAVAKAKIPNLGEMLDWRKAAPKAQRVAVPEPETAGKGELDAEAADAEPMVPPMDPATMTHFVLVQGALTPEESALAREVAKELTPAELRAWFDDLSKLSVPDAVAKIRKVIGGLGPVHA